MQKNSQRCHLRWILGEISSNFTVNSLLEFLKQFFELRFFWQYAKNAFLKIPWGIADNLLEKSEVLWEMISWDKPWLMIDEILERVERKTSKKFQVEILGNIWNFLLWNYLKNSWMIFFLTWQVFDINLVSSMIDITAE